MGVIPTNLRTKLRQKNQSNISRKHFHFGFPFWGRGSFSKWGLHPNHLHPVTWSSKYPLDSHDQFWPPLAQGFGPKKSLVSFFLHRSDGFDKSLCDFLEVHVHGLFWDRSNKMWKSPASVIKHQKTFCWYEASMDCHDAILRSKVLYWKEMSNVPAFQN